MHVSFAYSMAYKYKLISNPKPVAPSPRVKDNTRLNCLHRHLKANQFKYWNIDGRKRSNNEDPASPFLLANCSTNATAANVLVSAHSSTVPSITIWWVKKSKTKW
ncbi:hypothetical protein CDAR_125081 [Caerostris darwini]|uniref:Uncharacterized protein n=1 Tax=Caerostris darwini TaxID=1538125 RepID=A0AAV4MHI0_9ARAC|nr:hypothetical protein CDAR_125081 [Caerostris darwini]